jgi:LmbE family N-acetylglucosaminyl deacetylase
MSEAAATRMLSGSLESERHAVVVAHPDDEALWLSSALAGAARVIFCFGAPYGKPEKARARRNAVAALALPGLADLAIPESGAGFSFDWCRPEWSDFGVVINVPRASARYRYNFGVLLAALKPLLSGVDAVYTHNPWGEYGHAEHVQVYRALTQLQRELGFVVWFSNYVGDQSWPMVSALLDTPLWFARRVAPSQSALARRLQWTYLRHGAWTWNWTHRWPSQQILYAQSPLPNGNEQTLRGEHLIDVGALRWWPLSRRPLRRSLPRR